MKRYLILLMVGVLIALVILFIVNRFAVQAEIDRTVTSELGAAPDPSDEEVIKPVSTRNLDAHEAYLQGREYLKRRPNKDNLRLALVSFYESASFDPGFAGAYAGECEVQLNWYRLGNDTNRFESAESACQKALSIAPGMTEVRVMLGRLHRYDGQYTRATEEIQKALTTEPDHVEALTELGISYFRLGEYEAATTAWDRALQVEPSHAAYTHRGLAYYYDGQFEEAARMQFKAIELAPDDHRAWGRLGEAWRLMEGHEEQSLDAYGTAIEKAEAILEPGDQDWITLGMLATYYAHTDRPDEANEFITRARALSGNHPESLLHQARVLYASGDFEGAKTALSMAVEKDGAYQLHFRKDPDLRHLDDPFRSIEEAPEDG